MSRRTKAITPYENEYLNMITREQKELFRKKVGKLLEQRRLEKGMSRKELGETLGYEGNSAIQVVARFESGRAGVPKTKIDKLLKLLEINNADFGLSGSKSLKTFVTASGFLGSTMSPWSEAMIGFLENSETSFVQQTLSEEDDGEKGSTDPQTDSYQDVLRIMRLYRIQNQEAPRSLLERLELMDRICEGNEDKLAKMLVAQKIDPLEAYQVIENHLMERLKESRP
jgi:transcriptional regulator with XRE-family HTH domain